MDVASSEVGLDARGKSTRLAALLIFARFP